MISIKCSKTSKTIPEVLTKKEMKNLISTIDNPKHQLIVKLMYSAGLRLSEIVNLRIKDLNIAQGIGFIRKGKGNKDRPFIIANSIKEELSTHISNENNYYDTWLFKGQKNSHLSSRSIQNIVKKAAKAAKILKKVHPHTLRHSFATHLIQDGNEIRSVQSLLGHKSIQTTQVYIHAAGINMISIQSPIDSLN
jgi:integrase/recombinase XerD